MKKTTLLSLILAGGSGVAAMVLASYLMADQGPRFSLADPDEIKTTTLVVAAKPMVMGQRITVGDLKTIKWMASELPEGGFAKELEVLPDANAVRHVKASMAPGEPVLLTKISKIGDVSTLSNTLLDGMKAVSIRVNDVLGVAGFVRPGDRVDVLASWEVKEGDTNQTKVNVILQGVKVLAVDQTADKRVDKPTVVKTVTLEVSTREAQALTLAAGVGTLSLALRNMASKDVSETRPLTMADLTGGSVATTLSKEVPVKLKSATVGVWNSTTRVVHQVQKTKQDTPAGRATSKATTSSKDDRIAMR